MDIKRLKKAISNLLFECEGIPEERYRYCLTCGDVDVLQKFVKENTEETITNILLQQLEDVYWCTRAWSAWDCNTMSEDDFEEVDRDFIEGIACEIVNNLDKRI